MLAGRVLICMGSIVLWLNVAVRGAEPDPKLAGEPDPVIDGRLTDKTGQDHLELRTARGHPVRYYLSLPEGYERSPGKRWPILLAVAGNGSDFTTFARGYLRARGELPVLIVIPVLFSCNYWGLPPDDEQAYRKIYPELEFPGLMQQGAAWDKAGLQAILADLQADFDAEDRFYLTGFSMGGLLTYDLILTRPHLLAGAIVVSGVFQFPEGPTVPASEMTDQERSMALRIYVGEKDPGRRTPAVRGMTRLLRGMIVAGVGTALSLVIGIRRRSWKAGLVLTGTALLIGAGVTLMPPADYGFDGNARYGEKLLKEWGFTNVERGLVPGQEHVPCEDFVMSVFRPYWEKK
jgi:predicted esterase